MSFTLCEILWLRRVTIRTTWNGIFFLTLAGRSEWSFAELNAMDENQVYGNLSDQLIEPYVRKCFYTKTLPKTMKLRIEEIYNISKKENGSPTNSIHGRCYYCL